MRVKTLAVFGAAILALTYAPAQSQTARSAPSTPAAPQAGMTEEDMAKFVAGNLMFMGFHELGHAVISEFDLPVIGKEEDGVDRLAIWLMTPDLTNVEEAQPEFLIYAIFGWTITAMTQAETKIAWWAQHGTNEQRGFQAACLLYGNSPPDYKAVADAIKLPRERRDSCIGESAQNDKSWRALLRPHIRSPKQIAKLGADFVTVEYTPTEEFEEAREFLMDIEILEGLANEVRSMNFEPGVTLRTIECQEPNAFWNKDERTLTICYELAQRYYEMVEPMLEELERKQAEQ